MAPARGPCRLVERLVLRCVGRGVVLPVCLSVLEYDKTSRLINPGAVVKKERKKEEEKKVEFCCF